MIVLFKMVSYYFLINKLFKVKTMRRDLTNDKAN